MVINLDAGPHGDWIKGVAVMKMIEQAKSRQELLALLRQRGWTEETFLRHAKNFDITIPDHLTQGSKISDSTDK